MNKIKEVPIISISLNFILLQILILGVNSEAQNEYSGAIQVRTTIIGKDQFIFVGTAVNGRQQPSSCRVCVFTPQNDSQKCCDAVDISFYTGQDKCNGYTFEKLQPGKDYQLNMCYPDTDKQILTHKFRTIHVPKIKKVTYDATSGLMTYNVQYRSVEGVPKGCELKKADKTTVTCTGVCDCLTGSVRIQPAQINDEFYLVDAFGGWLYVFKPNGPSSKDSETYTFKIPRTGIRSLPYTMTSIFGDITETSVCSIINTTDGSTLKCKVGESVTEKCLCKGGTLVELEPSTRYNAKIEMKNELIFYGATFSTAMSGQKIDHVIGMNKYKYTIEYEGGKAVDLPTKPCRACIIKHSDNNKCCTEHYYTDNAHCNTRVFTKENIALVTGRDFKINICDNYGDQVISDKFSMPKPLITVETTVTNECIRYKLNFEDNKRPTYCKFKILSSGGDQPTDSKCLNEKICSCYSGSIEYPSSLQGQATLIILDPFDEGIKNETINLERVDMTPLGSNFCTKIEVPEEAPTTNNPPTGEAAEKIPTPGEGTNGPTTGEPAVNKGTINPDDVKPGTDQEKTDSNDAGQPGQGDAGKPASADAGEPGQGTGTPAPSQPGSSDQDKPADADKPASTKVGETGSIDQDKTAVEGTPATTDKNKPDVDQSSTGTVQPKTPDASNTGSTGEKANSDVENSADASKTGSTEENPATPGAGASTTGSTGENSATPGGELAGASTTGSTGKNSATAGADTSTAAGKDSTTSVPTSSVADAGKPDTSKPSPAVPKETTTEPAPKPTNTKTEVGDVSPKKAPGGTIDTGKAGSTAADKSSTGDNKTNTNGGTTGTTADGNKGDNGESGNQGLSGGAIAGIMIGVLALVGSVGGVAYYMTQVKGKNSDESVLANMD